MRKVFKYPFPADDMVQINLPLGAEVLTVQVQHNELQLWALVGSTTEMTPRTFRMAGTGHPIMPDLNLKYVSTVQLAMGELVFHIFEVL